jgi:hypothetical protein
MDAPAVAVGGGRIAFAWMDQRDGNRDVFWTLGAASAVLDKLPPEQRAHADGRGEQMRPSLAIDDDGEAWCAYVSLVGKRQMLRVARWGSKDEALTGEDEGSATSPSIQSRGGVTVVVYESGADVRLRRVVK